MAACGESADAALCFHAYWSQHVLFRYHPPQISQPGLICSRWQHHTLLHARIQKRAHTHTSWISVSHRGDVFFSETWWTRLQWINIWCALASAEDSGRHVWTLHALRVDPQPPHQRCTQTNMSLTDTVNHTQIPKTSFYFVFSVGYMVCSRGEHETVQAFDSALSSAPVLVGSRSRHIRCELGHSLQREFHIWICVTGYTHLCSAGARACCQFGEKRRRAPGVWPLLPPSCAGFFPDSPRLARSPSFAPRSVSISAPFRRRFPSLFFPHPRVRSRALLTVSANAHKN